MAQVTTTLTPADLDKGGKDNFLLGDFPSFSRFLALTHAERMKIPDSAGSEVAE